MNEKNTVTTGAIILGFALIVGLAAHGWLFSQGRTVDTITVTGSVKTHVTSDLAKWTANFSRQATKTNVKDVLSLSARDNDAIRTFITGLGISEDAITFLPINTDPVYGAKESQYGGYVPSQEVTGYNVRQEVRVESANIAKIEELASKAKDLVDRGIVPEYQRTEYFYTKLAELRPQLFADATKDAYERAKAVASGTGVNVGALTSAKTGVVQILAPNSLDVADWGAYDTSTKEKEVSATVTVSFRLE